MDIKITFEEVYPAPLPEPVSVVIKTARTYGDPVMVELMGLDVDFIGTGNFQNVSLFTPSGGFGAVTQFQRLDKAALEYLVKIQPVDACPLNSKMAFLCGERLGVPDRPYWTRGGEWKELQAGNTSILFDFGTIVFGGQPIQVESRNGVPLEYKFVGKYQQAEREELITFYKLVGMRRADWVKPVPELMARGLIQRGTWAGSNNSYHATWNSGIVLHPVWAPEEYPSNYGSSLYIAKAFVK